MFPDYLGPKPSHRIKKNINIHEKLTHNKHERDYLNISSIGIYTWSQGQVFCVFHIFKTNFYEIENRKYN